MKHIRESNLVYIIFSTASSSEDANMAAHHLTQTDVSNPGCYMSLDSFLVLHGEQNLLEGFVKAFLFDRAILRIHSFHIS